MRLIGNVQLNGGSIGYCAPAALDICCRLHRLRRYDVTGIFMLVCKSTIRTTRSNAGETIRQSHATALVTQADRDLQLDGSFHLRVALPSLRPLGALALSVRQALATTNTDSFPPLPAGAAVPWGAHA